MTLPRAKFTMPPRGLTDPECAGYLGLAPPTFKSLLPRLESEGFPRPDKLTGRRDWKAIEMWMDERSGLCSGTGDKGLMDKIEEFRNGD